MLVQPEKRPQDGLNVTSSVKLRRKNLESVEKKRNRYSGGDFLIGSPARGHSAQPQPLRGQEVMRKSGEWFYVWFCHLSALTHF